MNGMAAALVAGLLAASVLRAEPVAIDGVTAWVDGTPITIMDVIRDSQAQFHALSGEKGLSRAELNARRMAIFRQVRRNLVDAELIYAAFQKNKAKFQFSITDQMVENRINDIVRDDFGGNREKLMKALAEDRVTYEEWREKMSRRVIVQGMRQREVMAKVQIPPQAVREYYEANRASYEHPGQVLLRRMVFSGPDAEVRSRQVMDRLGDGEDFGVLAKSPAGGSDPSGGSWGWRVAEDLSPALLEKLRVMRIGGVCRVDLGGDWQIVKLDGRDRVTFDEARATIEETLRRAEAQRLHELWMDKLEREFHVRFIEQSLWED
jgi:peptidyl-prolyl cis-trans isomerase SurA